MPSITRLSSIDAQSNLWHEDACGSLLLDRLLEAADRGVRVRLLIDGFKLEGHEAFDEALDQHPNLELRVFNPTLHRGGLWERVELLENLERLDHRMHNKLFLVDGVAGVFGGRNVGDEYFGLEEEADFRDFDLLAAGPVVADLARSFDEFWNGPWTVPLGDLVHLEARTGTHLRARSKLRALHAGDPRLDARRALEPADWLSALAGAAERMIPGRAHVLHDSAHVERAGAAGILAAGAELHELRADAWSHVHHRTPGSRARKLGLHAKSAVFGADHVLVGSMNVDPRSMELNTELGVLIESSALAEEVRGLLERELAARNAWRVEPHEDGGLRWTTLGLELREEPAMGGDEHAREWFLRLLPGLEGEV